MRLVIDIPEDIIVTISRMGLLRIPDEMIRVVDKAIQHSTPLPKGHGRLIDADELKKIIKENDILTMTGFSVRLCDIDKTPTIIEADTPSCDTCKYQSAQFNPCNGCNDKSEYMPMADKEQT